MCGENQGTCGTGREQQGSPPRVRGKLSRQVAQLANMRITPACAGKTFFAYTPTGAGKDHPRVCGENAWRRFVSFARLGSPPRVRGKPLFVSLLMRLYRITPACAGKTYNWLDKMNAKEDHPRVCGENWQYFRIKGT